MTWLLYAFVSAGAAALTAILAKIGVEGIPSTLATAIRGTNLNFQASLGGLGIFVKDGTATLDRDGDPDTERRRSHRGQHISR